MPEATLFEPPRPRKEDIKPGMSNVTVRSKRNRGGGGACDTEPNFNQRTFCFVYTADILHYHAGHDCVDCADGAGHHVLSEAQGELAQAVVKRGDCGRLETGTPWAQSRAE